MYRILITQNTQQMYFNYKIQSNTYILKFKYAFQLYLNIDM